MRKINELGVWVVFDYKVFVWILRIFQFRFSSITNKNNNNIYCYAVSFIFRKWSYDIQNKLPAGGFKQQQQELKTMLMHAWNPLTTENARKKRVYSEDILLEVLRQDAEVC